MKLFVERVNGFPTDILTDIFFSQVAIYEKMKASWAYLFA